MIDSNDIRGDAVTATNEKHESHKYERHLEQNILQNAINSGYLNELTTEDLLILNGKRRKTDSELLADIEKSNETLNGETKSTVEDIELLNLKSSRVRHIKSIGACINLTVCNLSCNYVQNFEALKNCRQLRKLDLHKNQITKLPQKDFWYQLDNLQVLFLHDNGISSFDEVKKMSASQQILILTMYDTPLSLKVHYRHFIVNSIWSLKALDHIALSDEELIEDAAFGKKFQSLQPQFLFKSKSLINEGNLALIDEITAIQEDITAVNKIQAMFCPVLIIQRFTRGFLTRLRYRYEQEKRMWAAVTIQRYYRDYSGIAGPRNEDIVDTLSNFSISSHHMDRSLASDRVALSVANTDHLGFGGKVPKQRVPHFSINLKEFETSTLKVIEENSLDKKYFSRRKERKYPSGRKDGKPIEDGRRIDIASLRQSAGLDFIDPFKERRNQSTKRLGVRKQDEVKSEEMDDSSTSATDGDIPFRLVGMKAPEMKQEWIEELAERVVREGCEIRAMEREIEEKLASVPKRIAHRNYPMTADQKLFIRTHGTMSLSCFRAVDEAYKDRDRAKNLSASMQRVKLKRQRRETILGVRAHAKYTFAENIMANRIEAKKELVRSMDEQRAEAVARKEHVATEKNKREKIRQDWRNVRAFAADFCCQNNAIAKALASHAGVGSKMKSMELKREKVRSLNEDVNRQKEIIKRYNDHRNLLLQSEVSLGRSKLDTELKERSLEDRREARWRVKKLKKISRSNKIVLPSITVAPPNMPSLAVVAETQMKTWEKERKIELKSRQHDRVDMLLS